MRAWTVTALSQPMVEQQRVEVPGRGEVIVQVAGCGICHTDLGFYAEGVPTRKPLPLTLGHEISGIVVEVGPGAEHWLGQAVVVPAVIPCGECAACAAGRGSVCGRQIFPGNDVHGGFASHVRVPARGLCPVPDLADARRNPARVDLPSLAVLADAVTTPFQAISRSRLGIGDLAVVVGAGGVGGFAVQIAAALGAHVVAIDVDPGRLDLVQGHGAGLALRAGELDFKALRKSVRAFAADHEVDGFRWRIFECSGTTAGQSTAFGLLEPGSYLSVVGFTTQKLELRLSNVMAFDATVQGNWGCLPELYPAALELVLQGKVSLGPFTEQRPLASINRSFADVHEKRAGRRIVLCPES
ncbi:MAG TPA: 6-hydroxycyclohex-1-ene-1-carbonyl-CoA dehydrogenase [Planctomycetota bacterium]|nr:6-hydroxycyclohex-1-ene-1-carbonyl-CoA dehydrogenase [Planctomycetota bacterium]